MAASYSYLFQDLLTRQVLGEMPVNGVSFDRQLNQPGNFQGSTNLDNDLIGNNEIIAMTMPGKTAVYVFRENQIVWGGIIWTRTYQSQSKSLQMTAQTFESYPYRRIASDPTMKFTQKNQSYILAQLWAGVQTPYPLTAGVCDIGVDISVAMASLVGSDVLRDLTIVPADMRYYGDYIDSLTAFSDGPDYYIDVAGTDTYITKTLIVGPRIGASLANTELRLDYPGCILNYFWTENNAENNTVWWAVGEGDGNSKVRVNVANQAYFNAGYPILEGVNTWEGVTSQVTATQHASDDLASNNVGKSKKHLDIKADESPVFGSYNLGDACFVSIDDARFYFTQEFSGRVVGWSVTPASSDAVEEVSLVLEGQEDSGGGA